MSIYCLDNKYKICYLLIIGGDIWNILVRYVKKGLRVNRVKDASSVHKNVATWRRQKPLRLSVKSVKKISSILHRHHSEDFVPENVCIGGGEKEVITNVKHVENGFGIRHVQKENIVPLHAIMHITEEQIILGGEGVGVKGIIGTNMFEFTHPIIQEHSNVMSLNTFL